MHLSGEADASDGIRGNGGNLDSLLSGDDGGAPPVARILFGPARFGTGERNVFFGAGAENAAGFVNNMARVPPVPTSMPRKWIEPPREFRSSSAGKF